MDNTKQGRLLEIFFRSLRGEDLSVKKLAAEYGVSTKSVSRDIGDLKAFLADHRELAGNTELEYSSQEKCYRLYMDEFLTNKELFALVEVMIGARAFSKEELLTLTGKLKKFTTTEDRPKLNELIRKELYHYAEVKHDCESVQETLWKLVGCIAEKREITIEYYRMDRACKTHRIRPASVMFTDYYFYLIAFLAGEDEERDKPLYFRADRIKRIVEHRGTRNEEETPEFDEGLLRKRSLFMWPGKLRTIRFEFSGPSVQAVLDKLPTAKIIERSGGKYTLEAEVYGDGIKMWLLSQGSWVKVTAPDEFAEEMKKEIAAMSALYAERQEIPNNGTNI
ncbi:WYL domain-containing transcriptional regulator [uncultured Cloacibacillus sp.]|uniref:helix-turn-helix transcriptional regulator n=1 Tax=uncultured Cloacibacillus sp. TaxID=889794 RepID=UPI0032097354